MDHLKPVTEKNNFIISVNGSFLPEVISWMFKLEIDFTTIKKEDDGFYNVSCIGSREDYLTLNGMFYSSVKH